MENLYGPPVKAKLESFKLEAPSSTRSSRLLSKQMTETPILAQVQWSDVLGLPTTQMFRKSGEHLKQGNQDVKNFDGVRAGGARAGFVAYFCAPVVLAPPVLLNICLSHYY